LGARPALPMGVAPESIYVRILVAGHRLKLYHSKKSTRRSSTPVGGLDKFVDSSQLSSYKLQKI
jgi:hypothetical protein